MYAYVSRTLYVLLLALALMSLSEASVAAPGGVAEGLRVWLRASSGIAATEGAPVTLWADQSGRANDARWNSLFTFGELAPTFDASNPGAAGQPTVRFEGQNALELDLNWLAQSDYTIFVVNGRDRFGLANFYVAGSGFGPNLNLALGYERPDLLRLAHFQNDLDVVVEPFAGVLLWSLDTFRFARSEGRRIFRDGSLTASDRNLQPLVSNLGSTLGHFRTYGPLFWFRGDLAEVVVYDRALSDQERLRVEAELAGRYGRPLEIEDYVPCSRIAWRNHGQYVSAHARAVELLVKAGVYTEAEGEAQQAATAQSSCGQ